MPFPRRPLLLLLLTALLLPGLLLRQPRPSSTDPLWLIPAQASEQSLSLTARLLEDPRADASGARCRALAQLAGGRSELQFRPCPPLQQGWRLELSGRLRRLPPAPHPLLAGPAERLQRQGVWSQLRVERWRLLERPPTPVADLRRHMGQALRQAGGDESGGVLAALVLGSAASPPPAVVRDAFRVAGLSHALAASGFHLTVLLGAVMVLARRLPGPLRSCAAAAAMGLFLLLAGPQPSVVRAVLMGAVAFALHESGRRSRPVVVLALCVALILICSPAWLLDVGFQLSAAATAGLILSAGPLEQGFRRWLPAWGAGALAVPVAASLWTLPLQLLQFGVLPIYAVPANLLVAPLLTPLTLGAMAMAVAAVLAPPLVVPVGWLLVPLAHLLVWLVKVLAALPLAQWQLGRLSPLLALLLALALAPWLLPQGRRWRWAGLGLLALVALLQWQLLRADQLLWVQDGGRHWLLARHGGRGALISGQADGFSCSRAAQLAQGLGIPRYDWVLLLDPVPSEQPACWRQLTPTLVAPQTGLQVLQPGQRLLSPGLSVEALASDSQALLLTAGRLRWGLLPDRQAWWSWHDRSSANRARLDGLWLGFSPRPSERRQLPHLAADRLWWPVAGSTSGWRQA
jgi:competence protein ComEC